MKKGDGDGGKLRSYLKEFNFNQEELATQLGMTRQGLNYHLNKEVLDYEFKMELRKHGVKLFDENGKINLSVERTTPNPGTPIYDIKATATQSEFISQLPEVPAFNVTIPGYEDCNFGMFVYGHSMYPTIENGSLILCRKVNDKSIILYGEIYLIRTADYLMVKRIQKNDTPGNVLCVSDNFEQRTEKSKKYEPFDIPRDKIIDLYLVKGIIKKTQS